MRHFTKSISLIALSAGLFAGAANADDSYSPFEGVRVMNDCISACDLPEFATAADMVGFMAERTAPRGAGGSPEGANGPKGLGLGLGLGLNAPQVVYLDFETGDPTFGGSLFGVSFTGVADYVYSQADKEEVRDRIAADYAPYNFEFVLEEPAEGDYVTLQFNSNDNPGQGTAGILPNGGILFGSAGEIDFGNDSRSVVAINDANFWTALNFLDPFFGFPAGGILQLFSGIDVDTDGPGPDTGLSADEALRVAVINQSANTGAHELGHGLGLRHYDAFGPIGGGLPITGSPDPASFFPVYAGPQNGDETTLHLMASGASSGLSLAGSGNRNRFFSERSAIKLAINERGRFVTDEQANSGQAGLKKLQVVNPILEGDAAGGKLDVRNIVIEGTIDELGELDTFTFSGKAGQVFNAEMISDVESSFFPDFDGLFGKLTLFYNDNGTLVEVAGNDDEFESFDAFLLDFELPADGEYVLQMEAPAEVFFGGQLVPLALFGEATERAIRLGQYITNVYIVENKPGQGPKKIGGPRK